MKIVTIESSNVNEFDKIIKEMPAFVKIFSPTCGHCIAMAPAWEKLKNNADLKNLNFALVALNSNTISDIKSPGVKNFNGVPTIREIKQGSGEAGKEYSGSRATEDMANFIKSTFKTMNNKTGKTKNKRGGGCGCEQNGGKRQKTLRKKNKKNKKTIRRK
jgi:thiol-disulfide isomerase/thioredoxin